MQTLSRKEARRGRTGSATREPRKRLALVSDTTRVVTGILTIVYVVRRPGAGKVPADP
jgi:hypothetical protein